MERRTHGTNGNGKVEYLRGNAVDIEEGPEECLLLRPLLSKGMGKRGEARAFQDSGGQLSSVEGFSVHV